jgi:hypothetical protein
MLEGLEVDSARMARNLELTKNVLDKNSPDVSSSLGQSEALVDRALALYRKTRSA